MHLADVVRSSRGERTLQVLVASRVRFFLQRGLFHLEIQVLVIKVLEQLVRLRRPIVHLLRLFRLAVCVEGAVVVSDVTQLALVRDRVQLLVRLVCGDAADLPRGRVIDVTKFGLRCLLCGRLRGKLVLRVEAEAVRYVNCDLGVGAT